MDQPISIPADLAQRAVETCQGFAPSEAAGALLCSEVNVLAELLRAFGAPAEAELWIEQHARHDDPGDAHYRAPGSPPAARPLPDVIPAAMKTLGPEEPHASFAAMECRRCGANGPFVRTDDQGAEHNWSTSHQESTGHTAFYMWTIARNTARVVRL